MNRKYKKAAGMILALAMATGVLSACGTDTGTGKAEETESQVSETERAGLPEAGAAAAGQKNDQGTVGDEQTADAADQENAPAGNGETVNGGVSADILSDPTLGGIFEVYTPEEYEEVIENIKKYADDGGGDVVKNMEADLEKLRADNGKGEFVLYKSAFDESYEENGYWVSSGFNPDVVMNPRREYRFSPEDLTAENYKKDIEAVTKTLDTAISKGMLTQEQKEIILAKMNDNLAALE